MSRFLTKPLRFLRRRFYDLRLLVPGLRERHQMEKMVGPVGYWNELRSFQFNALRAAGLAAHHSVLDLGCGPLQGGIAIIEYLQPGGYVGVDITARHLDAGYGQIHRLKLAHKNPRLIHASDFGQAQLAGRAFDYIWASQILYYFDDAGLAEVLRFVARHLNPSGRFVGDFINPETFERLYYPASQWNKHEVPKLEALARSAGFQARVLGRLEQFGYPRRLTLHGSLLLEFSRA